VEQRPIQRLTSGIELADDLVSVGDELPGLGQAQVVAECLQDGDECLHGTQYRLDGSGEIGVRSSEPAIQSSARGKTRVARGRRVLDRLGEDLFRFRMVS
jgi:hypothetical protein